MSQEPNNFESFDMDKLMQLLLELAYENLTHLDVNKQEDLDKLALILKKKISMLGIMEKEIEEELIFNIFNSLANENNKKTIIQGSLNFMFQALKVINSWEDDPKKYELPEMQVTVLSELLLNISNAELYLGQYDLVKQHSNRAIQIAQKVITNVLKFIKDPTHQNDDLIRQTEFMQRIQAHVQTQREILVHAHTREAEAQEQLAGNQFQKLNETLKCYERAYKKSEEIFGNQNNVSFEIDKSIQRIRQKLQKPNNHDQQKNKSAQQYTRNKKNNLSNDLNEVRTITDINDTSDHEDNFDGANKSIIQSSSKSTGKKRIKSPDEKEQDKTKFKHGGRQLKQKQDLKIKKRNSNKKETVQSLTNKSFQTDENFLNHSILGGYKSGEKVKKTRPISAKPAGLQTEKQINKRLDYGIMGASINHLDARQKHVYYDQAGYKKPKIYGYDIQNERSSHQLHDSCQSSHSAHRFSHQIQELGLTNAIQGPKSWHYVLNPPKYRMSVQRLRNSVFVKPISNQSTTNHKVIKMKSNQNNQAKVDLTLQVEILKLMREKVKQNEEDRKRNIEEVKLKIDKENLEALKEFEKRVVQLELEHQQMEIEVLGEMERQRHLIELHEKEMQEEQQLTIELVKSFQEQLELYEQQESSDSDEVQCQCNTWQCLQCNPPPANADEDFGPPVFDPYYKCWTFPYAKPKPEEVKVEKIKYVPRPIPQSQSIEIQVIPPPEPKIPSSDVIIQTIEFKIPQNSQETQSSIQYSSAETQTLEKQIDLKSKALIIQKFLWKLVMKSRLLAYRDHKGILISRKYRISKVSGALEILSFFIKARFVDGMSSHIEIIIYDYVTRKFIFDFEYKNLRSIKLFLGWKLRHLCWDSLLYIPFEESPFNEHITAIQSIIDYNIPHDNLDDFEMSDGKSSDEEWQQIEEEIVEPKTPDPIIVYPEMVKKEARKVNTKSYCIKKIPFRRAIFIIVWWWKIKKAIRTISLLTFEGYNGFPDCINCKAYQKKANVRHCNNLSKMICKGRDYCEGCRGNWACSKKQKPGTCICCAESQEDFCKCTEARVWIVRQEKYRNYRYLRCYREEIFGLEFRRVDKVIIAETCKQTKCLCGFNRDFDVKLWKIYFTPGKSGQAPQNYKYSLEANETKESIQNHKIWKKKQGDLYDEDDKHIPTDFQQYIYENIRLPLSSEEMEVLEQIYGPEYFLPRRPLPKQEKIKVERMIMLRNGKLAPRLIEEDPEVEQKYLEKCKDFRGPQGEILFKYYFDNAILMEIEHNCRINKLKLVRVNINWKKEIPTVIKRKPDEIGCFKKLGEGFQLRQKGNQKELNHTCILYRRIRLINIKKQGKFEETKRKYKDWKIKVIDKATGQYDYIVFHKLPCKLEMMEEWLQDTLYVQLQDNVDPKPIDYLYWKVFDTNLASKINHCMKNQKDLIIYSLMFYREKDAGKFTIQNDYDGNICFSQRSDIDSNQDEITQRLPPIEYFTRNFINQPLQDTQAPLYEITIQRYQPIALYFPVIPYRTEGAINHSKAKNVHKYNKQDPEKIPDYSSSESEDDQYILNDSKWAWDKLQLKEIQVDDFTGRRQYRRIYIRNTVNQDDTKMIFYDQKLEELNKNLWPSSKDLYLQYMVNQMKIYQEFNVENNTIKIKRVLLKLPQDTIYFDVEKFYSQRLSNNSLRFIAQKKCNWEGQDFIKTIYCIVGQKGYVVEAIKMADPDERAYYILPNLGQAHYKQIQLYLDKCLELKGKKIGKSKLKNNQQSGKTYIITEIQQKQPFEDFLKNYKEESSSYEEEGEDEQEEEKEQEQIQKKK